MTGLRLDTAISKIQKRLAKLQSDVRADAFRPEIERFAQATLQDCINATPVRNEQLIVANQTKQYKHRVNFIPSFFELLDPSLRVDEDTGQAWIYTNGKWYNADWHLPDDVFAAYSELNQERDRRLQTAQIDFINERKQARFLYQLSWVQVAQSLGFGTENGSAILSSHSRHNPPEEPRRGYGQWRGGKVVYSVVIYNPLLDQAGKYWKGNGKAILAQATAKNRARFYKEVQDKIKRMISAARATA